MTFPGDAASCAALAADLAAGARRLREARSGDTSPVDDPDLDRTVDALDALAAALRTFAEGLRDPHPVRRGRPHPHTALRRALVALRDDLDDDRTPRGAGTVTP